MPIADIGELYNSDNVKVGSAMGMISPVGTPDPADSVTVFDPAVWLVTNVKLGGATGGTFTVILTGGPFATPATTAAIAFGATASAVKTAVDAILPAGYTSNVSGSAGNYNISVNGPRGGQITVTAGGGSLTGGTGVVLAASPWISAGATEQGWQVNWNPTTNDINIDEQPTPVDQQLTGATLQFVANLAEDTLQSWGLALNADKAVIAPGAGVYGKSTLTPNGTLKRYKVALETASVGDMPRRYIVPKMTCAANVGSTFRRAGGNRLIPVTFTSVCKFTDIQVVEITAAPTS